MANVTNESSGGIPTAEEVQVVLYSEDIERLITPSQFEKLNSFSTTLIRVLSQFDQKYRNLCEFVETSEQEKFVSSIPTRVIPQDLIEDPQPLLQSPGQSLANNPSSGNDSSESLHSQMDVKTSGEGEHAPTPTNENLAPAAMLQLNSSFFETEPIPRQDLERKVTDLSTLVTEEQSKTESLMRSLSSLNDRCERNVTRSEYQSDLQAIENRLGHSLLTSQTTNANAIEKFQQALNHCEERITQFQTRYQSLEKVFADYRLNANHDMMELLRKQEDSFSNQMRQMFQVLSSSKDPFPNTQPEENPKGETKLLSSAIQESPSPVDESLQHIETEALLNEQNSPSIDSLEEKVRQLHTKLMYQEFELNQLKSKLKTDVDTLTSRSLELRDSIYQINQAYGSQERWNSSIDRAMQKLQFSQENLEREIKLLNSRMKFKAISSSNPSNDAQGTDSLSAITATETEESTLDPVSHDLGSEFDFDSANPRLDDHRSELEITPRTHRERIDSITSLPSISDITLPSRRESHLIDKTLYDSLEFLKKLSQQMNQRIDNQEINSKRTTQSLQCIIDNLVKMGNDAAKTVEKNPMRHVASFSETIEEEDPEEEKVEVPEFTSKDQWSTSPLNSQFQDQMLKRLVEENQDILIRIAAMEEALNHSNLSAQNVFHSLISVGQSISSFKDFEQEQDQNSRNGNLKDDPSVAISSSLLETPSNEAAQLVQDSDKLFPNDQPANVTVNVKRGKNTKKLKKNLSKKFEQSVSQEHSDDQLRQELSELKDQMNDVIVPGLKSLERSLGTLRTQYQILSKDTKNSRPSLSPRNSSSFEFEKWNPNESSLKPASDPLQPKAIGKLIENSTKFIFESSDDMKECDEEEEEEVNGEGVIDSSSMDGTRKDKESPPSDPSHRELELEDKSSNHVDTLQKEVSMLVSRVIAVEDGMTRATKALHAVMDTMRNIGSVKTSDGVDAGKIKNHRTLLKSKTQSSFKRTVSYEGKDESAVPIDRKGKKEHKDISSNVLTNVTQSPNKVTKKTTEKTAQQSVKKNTSLDKPQSSTATKPMTQTIEKKTQQSPSLSSLLGGKDVEDIVEETTSSQPEGSIYVELDSRLSAIEESLYNLYHHFQTGGDAAYRSVGCDEEEEQEKEETLLANAVPHPPPVLDEGNRDDRGATSTKTTEPEWSDSLDLSSTPTFQASIPFANLECDPWHSSPMEPLDLHFKEVVMDQFNRMDARLDGTESLIFEVQNLIQKQAYEIQKLYQRIGLQRLDTIDTTRNENDTSPDGMSSRMQSSRSSDIRSSSSSSPSQERFRSFSQIKTVTSFQQPQSSFIPAQIDTVLISSDLDVPVPVPIHSIEKLNVDIEAVRQSQDENQILLESLRHSHDSLKQQLDSLKLIQTEDLVDVNSQINSLKDNEIQVKVEFKEKYLDLERRFNDLDKEIGANLFPREEIERALYSLTNELHRLKKTSVDKEYLQNNLQKKVDCEEFQRLLLGLTALIGDPFTASANPSAMYKCLVCDKPVTTPSTAADANANYSTQYITHYDSDVDGSRSTILHSPIKKMNSPNLMATAASSSPIRPLTHQSSSTTLHSPSASDLPLPPVIASPAHRNRTVNNSRAGSQLSRRIRSSAGGGIGLK